MSAPGPGPLMPVALGKEGDGRLAIQWNDGHRSAYAWDHLRKHCPCAACREERQLPPDPFRVLKPGELAPLRPLRMEPVGRYAYKITWNDGHDTGIYAWSMLRAWRATDD